MAALMPIEEVERIRDENEELRARMGEIGDILAHDMTGEELQIADEEYDALLRTLAEQEPTEPAQVFPQEADEELDPARQELIAAFM
jgi:NAD-dependent DNA ligase